MEDLTPVLRRVGQLCATLESDAELRDELELAGFPGEGWDKLAEAVQAGAPQPVLALLDAVEAAAAAAGVDGVTHPTREFRPLPGGLPEFRTITGWRCPHVHRCGRVHPATDPSDVQTCAVTGDPLTWISLDSR